MTRFCGALALASALGCQSFTGLSMLSADGRQPGGTDSTLNAADGGSGSGDQGEMSAAVSSGAGGHGGSSDAAQGGASDEPGSAGQPAAGAQAVDDAAVPPGSDCMTRITYGAAWIRPSDRAPTDTMDVVDIPVTWDGNCSVDDKGNSYAVLSNTWRPFFKGHDCVIAIDVAGSCAPTTGCSTRITYGDTWNPPPSHPDRFDDVPGALTLGACRPIGDESTLALSNGWRPTFKGSGCPVTLRYSQCGGLYANPVVDADCPDPGVTRGDDTYIMACSSALPDNPIRTSEDLVHWTLRGSIFTPDLAPTWATQNFVAPEIHRIGERFVAYFTARTKDGALAIGVATSGALVGPYADSGAPLVHDVLGAIDPQLFEAPDGTRHLLWKVDGNASGDATLIELQPLTSDGLALDGPPITILDRTLPWEATLVQHPWLIFEAGYYYLFYVADDPSSDGSAIGVARAMALTGPYTKASEPILKSGPGWPGPGLGSVIRGPSGDWVLVFDAWYQDQVLKTPPGRQVLVARMFWADGWPHVLDAPTGLSQPLP